MKRKLFVIYNIVIVAALLVAVGFAINYGVKYENFKRAQRYTYMSASSELSESISDMSASLQKSLYATSPQLLTALSSEIWSDSAKAMAAMSSMPACDTPYESTQTFISRAGDYAYYIARRAAAGERPSDEELDALRSLSDTAKTLSQNICSIEGESYTAADYPISSMSTLETDFPEYTTINYDGAMSEDAVTREVKLTGNEVSVDEALQRAATVLGMDSSELVYSGESGGDIPLWSFITGDDSCQIDVTKTGGYIYSLRRDYADGGDIVDKDTALDISAQALVQCGYDNMSPRLTWTEGGCALTQYVLEENDVAVYPDSVNVGVASDGTVVRLDAESYIRNHTVREIESPAVTSEQAQEMLADELSVTPKGLAVITTAGNREVLCYEFKCKAQDGCDMVIYSDAMTGQESQISIMCEDGRGTRVI